MLSTIVSFPLLLFLNLEPLENGRKSADNFHKMGTTNAITSGCRYIYLVITPLMVCFPTQYPFHYSLLSIIIILITLNNFSNNSDRFRQIPTDSESGNERTKANTVNSEDSDCLRGGGGYWYIFGEICKIWNEGVCHMMVDCTYQRVKLTHTGSYTSHG